MAKLGDLFYEMGVKTTGLSELENLEKALSKIESKSIKLDIQLDVNSVSAINTFKEGLGIFDKSLVKAKEDADSLNKALYDTFSRHNVHGFSNVGKVGNQINAAFKEATKAQSSQELLVKKFMLMANYSASSLKELEHAGNEFGAIKAVDRKGFREYQEFFNSFERYASSYISQCESIANAAKVLRTEALSGGAITKGTSEYLKNSSAEVQEFVDRTRKALDTVKGLLNSHVPVESVKLRAKELLGPDFDEAATKALSTMNRLKLELESVFFNAGKNVTPAMDEAFTNMKKQLSKSSSGFSLDSLEVFIKAFHPSKDSISNLRRDIQVAMDALTMVNPIVVDVSKKRGTKLEGYEDPNSDFNFNKILAGPKGETDLQKSIRLRRILDEMILQNENTEAVKRFNDEVANGNNTLKEKILILRDMIKKEREAFGNQNVGKTVVGININDNEFNKALDVFKKIKDFQDHIQKRIETGAPVRSEIAGFQIANEILNVSKENQQQKIIDILKEREALEKKIQEAEASGVEINAEEETRLMGINALLDFKVAKENESLSAIEKQTTAIQEQQSVQNQAGSQSPAKNMSEDLKNKIGLVGEFEKRLSNLWTRLSSKFEEGGGLLENANGKKFAEQFLNLGVLKHGLNGPDAEQFIKSDVFNKLIGEFSSYINSSAYKNLSNIKLSSEPIAFPNLTSELNERIAQVFSSPSQNKPAEELVKVEKAATGAENKLNELNKALKETIDKPARVSGINNVRGLLKEGHRSEIHKMLTGSSEYLDALKQNIQSLVLVPSNAKFVAPFNELLQTITSISSRISEVKGNLTSANGPKEVNAVGSQLVSLASDIDMVVARAEKMKTLLATVFRAEGGKVVGPGTSTSDSINLRASNGEYVVNAKATSFFEPIIEFMNSLGNGKGSIEGLKNALANANLLGLGDVKTVSSSIKLDGVSLSESSISTIKKQLEDALSKINVGVVAGSGLKVFDSQPRKRIGFDTTSAYSQNTTQVKNEILSKPEEFGRTTPSVEPIKNVTVATEEQLNAQKAIKEQYDITTNVINGLVKRIAELRDEYNNLPDKRKGYTLKNQIATAENALKLSIAGQQNLANLYKANGGGQLSVYTPPVQPNIGGGGNAGNGGRTSKKQVNPDDILNNIANNLLRAIEKRSADAILLNQKGHSTDAITKNIERMQLAEKAIRGVANGSLGVPDKDKFVKWAKEYEKNLYLGSYTGKRADQYADNANRMTSASLKEQMALAEKLSTQQERNDARRLVAIDEVRKKELKLWNDIRELQSSSKGTSYLEAQKKQLVAYRRELERAAGDTKAIQTLMSSHRAKVNRLDKAEDTARTNQKIANEAAAAAKRIAEENKAKAKRDAAELEKAYESAIKKISNEIDSLYVKIGTLNGAKLDTSVITARANELEKEISNSRASIAAGADVKTETERLNNELRTRRMITAEKKKEQDMLNKGATTSSARKSKTAYDVLSDSAERLRRKLNELKTTRDIAANSGKETAEIDKVITAYQKYLNIVERVKNSGNIRWMTILAARSSNDITNLSSRASNAKKLDRDAGFTAEAWNRAQLAQGSFQGQTMQTMRMITDLDQQFSMLAMNIQNAFSIIGIQQFCSELIKTGGELEKQQLAMSSILGSDLKAQEIYGKVANLSMISPFTVEDLVKNTKQLSAFGVEYDELYDTVKRLSDIAAAVGVDFSRIGYEYGQMESMGYLDRRHLRMFSMSGIPLAQELRKYYSEREGENVSQHALDKMISKREVSADSVKDILRNMTNEGGKFFNMQEIMAESLAAKYANLDNAWNLMLGDVAKGGFGDALKQIATILTDITKQWRIIMKVGGSALLFGVLKKISPIQQSINYRLGDLSSASNSNIKSYMDAEKKRLRTASMYRTLSAEENKLLNSKNTLLAKAFMNEKNLTKEAIAQMYAKKQINKNQLAYLNGNVLKAGQRFSAAELSKLTSGATRLKFAFAALGGAVKSVGVALKSLIWNPFTWIIAIMELSLYLYSAGKEAKQLRLELTNNSRNRAIEGLQKIDEVLENINKNFKGATKGAKKLDKVVSGVDDAVKTEDKVKKAAEEIIPEGETKAGMNALTAVLGVVTAIKDSFKEAGEASSEMASDIKDSAKEAKTAQREATLEDVISLNFAVDRSKVKMAMQEALRIYTKDFHDNWQVFDPWEYAGADSISHRLGVNPSVDPNLSEDDRYKKVVFPKTVERIDELLSENASLEDVAKAYTKFFEGYDIQEISRRVKFEGSQDLYIEDPDKNELNGVRFGKAGEELKKELVSSADSASSDISEKVSEAISASADSASNSPIMVASSVDVESAKKAGDDAAKIANESASENRVKISVADIKGMSRNEISGAIDSMRDLLKDIDPEKGSVLNDIFKTDEGSGEYIMSLEEQFTRLYNRIVDVNEAMLILKGNNETAIAGISAVALEKTGGLLFNDDLAKNLIDLTESSSSARLSAEKSLSRYSDDVIKAFAKFSESNFENASLFKDKNSIAEIVRTLKKVENGEDIAKEVDNILSNSYGSFWKGVIDELGVGNVVAGAVSKLSGYYSDKSEAEADIKNFVNEYKENLKTRGFDVNNLTDSQKMAIKMDIDTILDTKEVPSEGRDFLHEILEKDGLIHSEIEFKIKQATQRTPFQKVLLGAISDNEIAMDLDVKLKDGDGKTNKYVSGIIKNVERLIDSDGNAATIQDNLSKKIKESEEEYEKLGLTMRSMEKEAKKESKTLGEYAKERGIDEDIILSYKKLGAEIKQMKNVLDLANGGMNDYQDKLKSSTLSAQLVGKTPLSTFDFAKINDEIDELLRKSKSVLDIQDSLEKEIKTLEDGAMKLAPQMVNLQNAAIAAGESLEEYAHNNGFDAMLEQMNAWYTKYYELKAALDDSDGPLNTYQEKLTESLAENYIGRDIILSNKTKLWANQGEFDGRAATPTELAWLTKIDTAVRKSQTRYAMATSINAIWKELEPAIEKVGKSEQGKNSTEYKEYKEIEAILRRLALVGGFELDESNKKEKKSKKDLVLENLQDRLKWFKRISEIYSNGMSNGIGRSNAWLAAINSDAAKFLNIQGATYDEYLAQIKNLNEETKALASGEKEDKYQNLAAESDSFYKSENWKETKRLAEEDFQGYEEGVKESIEKWNFVKAATEAGEDIKSAILRVFKGKDVGGASSLREWIGNQLSSLGVDDWRKLVGKDEDALAELFYPGNKDQLTEDQLEKIKKIKALVSEADSERKRFEQEYQKAVTDSFASLSKSERYMLERNAIEQKYIELSKQKMTNDERDLLALDRAAKLLAIDVKELKENPLNQFAMNNLGTLSGRALSDLKDKFQNLFNNGLGDGLSADSESMKELLDNIKKIREAEIEGSFFGSISKSVSDSQSAAKELSNAYDALSVAEANLLSAQEEGNYNDVVEADKEVAEAKKRVAAAEIASAASADNLVKSLDKMVSSISQIGGMISNIGGKIKDGWGSVFSSFGGALSNVGDIATNIGKGGMSAVNGYVNAILTIFDVSNTLSDAVENMMNHQYEKAAEYQKQLNDLRNVVRDYSDAVLEAQQSERNWFGSTKFMQTTDLGEKYALATKHYYQAASEAQEQYQNKKHGGWGTYAAAGIVAAAGVAAAVFTAGSSLAAAAAGMAAILGTSATAAGVAIATGAGVVASSLVAGADALYNSVSYTNGKVAAINNLVIETRKKSNGWAGIGWGGHDQETAGLQDWLNNAKKIGDAYAKYMYGLMSETDYTNFAKSFGNGWKEMKSFAESAFKNDIENFNLFDENRRINVQLAEAILADETMSSKLQGETKNTLEMLVKYGKQMEEVESQIKEIVADLYNPLVGNLTSALWDWFDNGADVMAKFKDLATDTFRSIATELINTMMYQHLFDGYAKQLENLQTKYSTSNGKMSEEQYWSEAAGILSTLPGDIEKSLPEYQKMLEYIETELNKAGFSLHNGNSSGTSTSIKGITEETADILAAYVNGIRGDLNIQLAAVEWIAYTKMDEVIEAISYKSGDVPMHASARSAIDYNDELMLEVQNGIFSQLGITNESMNALVYSQMPELNATAESQLIQLEMQTEYLRQIQESNNDIREDLYQVRRDLHSVIDAYGNNRLNV